MLKPIVAVLAGCIGIVLALAAMQPDSFRIERSLAIKAPPERIYPHITDLRSWAAWSPYEKKDPAMKRTFSGAAAGPGSAYAWEGNSDVGAGRMQIVEAKAPSDVRIRLDFREPMESHSVVEFTLRPRAGETVVRWTMHGPQTFVGKVIGLFMDFDRMVGADFESGLASLKAMVEK
jgi:uncharacterized protein YndB with AHSA1/START domain